MQALLQLEPESLSKWASSVIQIGREKGFTDNDIKSWIKQWAKLRNYDNEAINHVLRLNGIRVYNRRPVIYQRYPKLVVCPRCVTIGKINVHYPCGNLRYLILHERIEGTWGQVKKIYKHRRCYIWDKESLEYIRQKLDFYENRDREAMTK